MCDAHLKSSYTTEFVPPKKSKPGLSAPINPPRDPPERTPPGRPPAAVTSGNNRKRVRPRPLSTPPPIDRRLTRDWSAGSGSGATRAPGVAAAAADGFSRVYFIWRAGRNRVRGEGEAGDFRNVRSGREFESEAAGGGAGGSGGVY